MDVILVLHFFLFLSTWYQVHSYCCSTHDTPQRPLLPHQPRDRLDLAPRV